MDPEVQHADHSARVRLAGDLTYREARKLHELLRRLGHDRRVEHVILDFSAVGQLDSAGVVAARLGADLLTESGKTCELENVLDRHQAAFDIVPEAEKKTERAPRRRQAPIARLGETALGRVQAAARVADLVVDTGLAALSGLRSRDRRRIGSTVEQAVIIGVDAVFIVGLLSFLIGLILAFQAAYQLGRFGAEMYTADLVSLGMVREFGAVITAIVVAGRSGSAMAAEIGTMVVGEETDALKTMGVSPVGYLVVPRVVAITLVLPLLTMMSNFIGIISGSWVAIQQGLSYGLIYHRMNESLLMEDFVLSLTKSVLFAWIIGFTGCVMGLRTRGGAHSVGRNTTAAVVASIFGIILVDSFVTTVWTVGHA